MGKFALHLDDSTLASSVGIVFGLLNSCMERLNWCIRQAVEVEIALTSVERLKHYELSIPQEDFHASSNSVLPSLQGKIEFQNVFMKYRPDLDFSLKDVSFTIPSKGRFAIVGRTGSGKSTIVQCLFRFFDIHSGQILLDGIDIFSLPLEFLRHSIAVIPQDPVLFTGSIRYNIDPFDEFSDADIWSVLHKSFLASDIHSLDTPIQSRGSNFSQGQRQLVCLARALIRNTQVIVLDEATASVDSFTDSLIQSVLAKECCSSTVIAIAHRLDTIIDYDEVIVMTDGSVVEKGNPRKLAEDSSSHFYRIYNS